MIYVIMQECDLLTVSVPIMALTDEGDAVDIAERLNEHRSDALEAVNHYKVVAVKMTRGVNNEQIKKEKNF